MSDFEEGFRAGYAAGMTAGHRGTLWAIDRILSESRREPIPRDSEVDKALRDALEAALKAERAKVVSVPS